MKAVATVEPRALQRIDTGPTPADLLRLAMEQKADPQYLRDLMNLQREWEANEARKAYVRAMAAFKAEPITITKDKHVSFSGTAYDHASIGNVTSQICAALGKHGFSHRWNTEQEGNKIMVSCVITHELGHFESTALTASPDDSGKKNAIQQIASTVTYLQRYTLLAATGMATSDQEDDDGRGGRKPSAEPQGDDDNPARASIIADLFAVADDGVGALTKAWAALPEASRKLVGAGFGAIKKKAEAVK